MKIVVKATCTFPLTNKWLGKNEVCGKPTAGIVPTISLRSLCHKHLDAVIHTYLPNALKISVKEKKEREDL